MNRVINHEAGGEYTLPGDLILKEEDCSAEAHVELPSPAPDFPISPASLPLLVNHIQRGAKPRERWQVGLEYELFGYSVHGLARINTSEVTAILKRLGVFDDLVIEPAAAADSNLEQPFPDTVKADRITVEPGGQIEFSSAPHPSLAEVDRSLQTYLCRLKDIAAQAGVVFLAVGFDPLRAIEEQHWYPKPRYEVMRPYLATRGERAWDMMCRTCAMQVSVDFDSDEDLANKYILGNRLAPVLSAMFANSPFENGKPSGYKSTRAATWLRTDPDRTGVSPFAGVFADKFSAQGFVDYTLGIPMIFARRKDRYLRNLSGLQFGRFLQGADPDTAPHFQDWTDHLTTIFTEARLKQYIEIRSADSGSPEMALALQALIKGLMYDADSLDVALRLVPRLTSSAMLELQEDVARHGLAAENSGVSLIGIAKEVVQLAGVGLTRMNSGEEHYLDPLREPVIEKEFCPADILLKNWNGSWHASIERVVEYVSIA